MSSPRPELALGKKATLAGLSTQALNGVSGVIESSSGNGQGRWQFRMDSGKIVLVKAENVNAETNEEFAARLSQKKQPIFRAFVAEVHFGDLPPHLCAAENKIYALTA